MYIDIATSHTSRYVRLWAWTNIFMMFLLYFNYTAVYCVRRCIEQDVKLSTTHTINYFNYTFLTCYCAVRKSWTHTPNVSGSCSRPVVQQAGRQAINTSRFKKLSYRLHGFNFYGQLTKVRIYSVTIMVPLLQFSLFSWVKLIVRKFKP